MSIILARMLPLAAVAALSVCAQAQTAATSEKAIYTCDDGHGRKLTSDRLIAECMGREQRVLNSDGSVRRILPPSMTADERSDYEAQERRLAAERAAQKDAVRRDRNLMARYPDEATHRKARESALDDMRVAMKTSEARLRELSAERKPLMDESEFYKGRAMPTRLKQQLEANDVATEAQKQLIVNQQAELERINALYDAELSHLRKLWAGAQPGSIGPTPMAASSAPARK
jgi:hypothetical protein